MISEVSLKPSEDQLILSESFVALTRESVPFAELRAPSVFLTYLKMGGLLITFKLYCVASLTAHTSEAAAKVSYV